MSYVYEMSGECAARYWTEGAISSHTIVIIRAKKPCRLHICLSRPTLPITDLSINAWSVHLPIIHWGPVGCYWEESPLNRSVHLWYAYSLSPRVLARLQEPKQGPPFGCQELLSVLMAAFLSKSNYRVYIIFLLSDIVNVRFSGKLCGLLLFHLYTCTLICI